MAMEMAMLVMVVTFTLGALMVTVALMQNDSTTKITDEFKQELELEQIGESFCEKIKTNQDIASFSAEGYFVSVDAEGLILTVRENAASGDILMTVDVDEKNGTYEIVKWEIN